MYSGQVDEETALFGSLPTNQEGKAGNIPKTLVKKDLMTSFDLKERRYQEEAKVQVKKNSVLAQALHSQTQTQVRTRIVSDFKNLNAVTSKLQKEH
jgi:hypothetical protein